MSESFTFYPNASVMLDNDTGKITIDPQPTTIEDHRPCEVDGSTSDGYHTFDELYEFRMLYHASFVRALGLYYAVAAQPNNPTVKSWKHSDGELCFGGGWFIVVTDTPEGQISNHYEAKHWDLFQVPEVETPPEFDGHTAADVLTRLRAILGASR